VPDRPPLPPPPANPAPPKKDDGKKDDGKKENNGNNGRPDNNRTTPPAPVVVPPRAPAPSPNPQPQPQPQPEPGPQPGPGPQPLSDGAAGGVNATADDRRATVSWSPPSNWRTVTGYTVTVQPGNIRHEAGPDARSWTATGLTNGTAYTFTVTANSAEGPGKTVPSGSVTPAAVAPGAPRSISVAPGDGVVDVSWQSPGGGVDEFRVDVLDGGGAVAATRTTTTTSASLNGLTNGTTYTAVVVAINGPTSTPSPPSSSFVPRGRPAAPAPATAAITALLTVTVSWTPPADTGGSPITGYEVSNNGATPQTVGAGVTSLAFPGLVEGSTYTFTVRAVTAVGTSGPATAPAVTVERAVPSAPANVIAVADDGTATLSWDASAGNGTTVTGYTVTSSAGGTYPATGTSASVTGLSNGTSYTFEVRANGANGTQSGPGGSNAVTPSGTPDAPVITGASSTGRTGIQVSFSQASPSNGTTVNGWTATVNGNPVPVGGSPLSVGGLAAGTTYTVEIRANGANGRTSGAASTTVTTDAPLPVPGAVTGLTLSDSDITWVAASNAAYYIVTGTGGLNQRVDAPTTSLAWFFDYGVRVSVTVTPYNAEGVAGASQSRSVRFYDDCGNPSPVPKPRPQPCP
jgi:hypothetical protein